MQSVLNFLLSIIITIYCAVIPFGGGVKELDPDNIRLEAQIVSDTHIDARLPIGQAFLTAACMNTKVTDPDVFIDLGDITNYGDAASVKRHFEICSKFIDSEITQIHLTGNHDLGHSEDFTNDEARENFVSVFNEFMSYRIDKTWYSKDVNGYTFIVMGDEDPDNWDLPEYSDEQLAFVDSELARGTADGKPVFVMAHVPLAGIHGEEYYYDGVTEEPWSTQIKTMLEKYDNVFFFSGHVHKGLGNSVKTPTYTTVNGVHYMTLPSFLMPNWPQGGITNHGVAFMLEIYDGEVVLRARNCVTQKWYKSFEYSEPIV